MEINNNNNTQNLPLTFNQINGFQHNNSKIKWNKKKKNLEI